MVDDDGFEKFVHANLHRLILHVIKLGATVDEAKDAVAEALADAWQHWKRIDRRGSWVRLAAAHAYFRAARRGREQVGRALQGGMMAEQVPDGLDVCGEEAATVLRLIQQLPPPQRHVMALTYDGYTASEIAPMLQLSRDTVRSHLRHARAQLRKQLSLDTMRGEDDVA